MTFRDEVRSLDLPRANMMLMSAVVDTLFATLGIVGLRVGRYDKYARG